MTLEEALAEAHGHFNALRRVGTGRPADYTDACRVGDAVVALAVAYPSIARRQDMLVRLDGEAFAILHDGPVTLIEPDGADGRGLAFVVAGEEDDLLVVLGRDLAVAAEYRAPGRIEQIDWAADGAALLLVVAEAGTDSTTAAGAIRRERDAATLPLAREYRESGGRRRLVSFDPTSGTATDRSPPQGTCWEAVWAGDAIVALWSADCGESGWYRPQIVRIAAHPAAPDVLYRPKHQVGHLAACPDGRSIVFVEGVASDRGLVAGELRWLAAASQVRAVALPAVDVSSVRFRGSQTVQVAGLAGPETLIGDVDVASGRAAWLWRSSEGTAGPLLPTSRPVGERDAIAILHGLQDPPRPALIGPGDCRLLGPVESGGVAGLHLEPISWPSAGDMTVAGLLLRPADLPAAAPVVLDVHGGPVWAWLPRWQGHLRAAPLLARHGIAVLFPNPRGSAGRGTAYAAAVTAAGGGMGGVDADDLLAAIDHLAASGLIDPERVGVTGSSYGGYMAALLPKLRPGIAAAVPISPVADWFSQHLTSNMPALEDVFLGGPLPAAADLYTARSPALRRERTRAPTLILAGELDRCVPLGQAIELYRALREQDSPVSLVTYPCEGHSLRGAAGYIDSAARTLAWFREYLRRPGGALGSGHGDVERR